jgi:hypothetical protein
MSKIKTRTLFGLAWASIGISSGTAFAASQAERTVGVGLGFASPDFALDANPAALGDVVSTSLSALYFPSPNRVMPSARLKLGAFALGASFLKDLELGQSVNVGTSVSISRLSLGASVRNLATGGPAQLDLGLNYSLSVLRFTILARQVESQVTELDVGVSGRSGLLILALDIKKPAPLMSGDFLVDGAFGLLFGRLELSGGLAYVRGAGTASGTVHGDLAWKITPEFLVQAFYNPISQESSPGSLGAGLKIQF